MSMSKLTPAEKLIYGIAVVAGIVAAVFVFAFVPSEFGKVDQGRVIAYDKDQKIVTFIKDRNEDPKKPDYSTLPPHQYKMPPPTQMGPEPKAGQRMKLDPEKNQITIYDDETKNLKVIPFTMVDLKKNVKAKDPLVEGKKFPIIDKEKKTITIYSKRLQELATISVPDEEFNKRKPETWDSGDEVRVYSQKGNEATPDKMGQAFKFMNISKTDIYKK